jgi:hypothetical protein
LALLAADCFLSESCLEENAVANIERHVGIIEGGDARRPGAQTDISSLAEPATLPAERDQQARGEAVPTSAQADNSMAQFQNQSNVPSAVATCPKCGGSIEVVTGADELLRLLTAGDKPRQVYRAANGSGWYITYTGTRVSVTAVDALLRAGKIQSVYSDCPRDTYHVGKTLDVKTTIEERKKHRRGKDAPKIYTDGSREPQ